MDKKYQNQNNSAQVKKETYLGDNFYTLDNKCHLNCKLKMRLARFIAAPSAPHLFKPKQPEIISRLNALLIYRIFSIKRP